MLLIDINVGADWPSHHLRHRAEDVAMAYPTLMVHLVPGVPNEHLLKFTADLAGRVGARAVIGIAACQPIQVLGENGFYLSPEVIVQDRTAIEKDMKDAETRFAAALKGKGLTLEWRSAVTYSVLAEYVAQQMRAADLLIAGPDQGSSVFDATGHIHLADLAMWSGRPVLVVGPRTDRLDLDNVVIGWKDSREARRAVEDAVPLLKMAKRVTVAEVADGDALSEARGRTDDVIAWLRRHDIAASSRVAPSAGDDAAQLAAIVDELGAGLLVAGAYGHNRLREWVLGGVTRDLLLRPSHCSFISH